MDFYIDKTRVYEGDIVEVKWKCPNAESVKITINNGFKSATADVENQGSKKYKLNRSNGQTVISLDAMENGKPVRKELKIKVRQPKPKKEEKVYEAKVNGSQNSGKQYDSYKRVGHSPFREKWDAFKTRLKYFWQALPPQKKQAYILLLIILVIMIVSSFYPKIIFFGMSILSLYLLWTLMKR